MSEKEVLRPAKYLTANTADQKVHLIVFKKPLHYVVLTSSLKYSSKLINIFLGNLKEYRWLDSSSCKSLNGFEMGTVIPFRIRLMFKLRIADPMKFFLTGSVYTP